MKFFWFSSRIRNPAIFLTTDSRISFTHNVTEFLWNISLTNFTCIMQVDQQEADSYRNLSLNRHLGFKFDKTVTVTAAEHISSFSHHTWYYDAKARIAPNHPFNPSPIVDKTGNVRINVTFRRVRVTIFCCGKVISVSYSECVSAVSNVRIYYIFQHHLINGTISEKKKVIDHKIRVFIFSTNLSATFLILRRIERDIIINVHPFPCKVTLILLIL